MDLIFKHEPGMNADEFIDVLVRSTLSARRPADDKQRMQKMIDKAQLIVTCRSADGRLIGVARSITDYSYCTYLSDLAVDVKYQKKGIGKELIKRTHELAGLNTSLILLSAPGVEEYYEHIGLTKHNGCFMIKRVL